MTDATESQDGLVLQELDLRPNREQHEVMVGMVYCYMEALGSTPTEGLLQNQVASQLLYLWKGDKCPLLPRSRHQ